MSHATVMVINRKGSGSDVDELLAPYDENLEVDPYIYKTKKELIEEVRADAVAFMERPEKDRNEWGTKKYSKIYKKIKDGTVTDEELYSVGIEGYDSDELDEDGNVISHYNPNSKWDWYEIGGRWSGLLILKGKGRKKETADRALAGEIDWDAMYSMPAADKKKHTDFWKYYVEGKPLPEDASEDLKERLKWTFYKPEYYKKRYHSLKNYLFELSQFETFAVLDSKEGWMEPGTMGWFGCSSASEEGEELWTKEFRTKFIDTLDPEDEIIIVDYHI